MKSNNKKSTLELSGKKTIVKLTNEKLNRVVAGGSGDETPPILISIVIKW